MADEKKIATITFQGGRNTDVADQLLPDSQFRRMLNMRVFSIGDKGIATNILGTTLISNDLPAGDNLCIGRFSDEENNCFYYCIWNSHKYHTIYQYNDSSRTVVKVLQNLTDTNNVDILRWSKDKKYWLLHIDVINGTLFTFVDGGLNKARKFNIKKAMDKTSTGYGLVIPEDFITAYKQTAIYAPACRYITDTTRNSNNLYSNLAKFCQWWQYDDLEISNVSDWSLVPKPSDQSYTGVNSITFDNNCIEVTVATGNALVKKIFVAVQLNHLEEIANDVVNTDFQVCVILDKEELSIPDNSTYVYKFYNDGGYLQTSQDRINRNYSFMQRAPVCQAFVKSAMTYTGGKEGWEVVHTKIAVALRLDPLYLPDNTDNKLSNASLIANEQSVDKSGAFLSKKRYNVTTKFIIGAEVRKGVKYEIFGQNGKSDNYYYSFIANGSDTASTIASYIKGALRSIGRGVPDGGNGISAEGTDGSGNVYFNFDYLGQYGESKIVWTTHVTQVSYNSLKDNGTSQQLIPGGSITNYAVVYVDDDGRESLACANSLAVIRTPYVTEVGDYKKPVHVISISHTPPVDAKYWKLVRTPQSHGIEILIQKVVDVTTDNTSEYLDLVVGSLLTYQKLHQNTILQYDFTAGDRLRLIKNVDTGTFYTGFFETEILSYLIETTNNVDHNAVLHANDQVTVGTATPDNIGKIISINGYERTIIGVVGGDTYRVDAPYVTSDTYPNYILIDRRGTIRIKKPTGITITDNTLVELLHPQSTEITTDYKLYRDCGQKYEVSDWGTPQRAHRGNVQNQTASQPAIIEISTGDAYIRDRELPVNNVVPGTQVLISKVIDANYSDFYISNMSDLGRVYPQDDGKGVVDFGSRTRYSGNYIVDTGVNGLNDFDNTARVDNNDAYGDIRLTKFKNNRLWGFKTLKDTWMPVNHTLTTDASGNVLNVSSGKLLNEMQYEAWEGGIGNFPESWFYNGNNQYHASPNSGCFIRIGGSGVEPISTLYNFDKEGRHILSIADKYNLPLIGEYDRKYDEAIWSYPSFIEYLYNDGFSSGQWQTSSDLLPDNVTYEVTQQPATGSVTYDNTLGSFLVSDTAVGNDYFLYRPVLGGGNYGAIKKQCITTVVPANRSKGWLAKAGTEYCVKKEVITIDYEVVEAPDFADANLTIEVNGVDVKTVNNTETGSVEVSVGDSVRFIATGELSATGFNPTIRMYYDKSGVQQYDSGEIADNPPPTVAFATPLFTILSGADYYVNVTSKVATVNPFAFTPQIEVSPSTPIPSNTITVGGSGGPVPISVVNGMYSINSGPYTGAAGSVNIGDTVSVQVMSSSAYKTAASATLTIADQSATFTVTTFHVFTLNFHNQDQSVPYSDSNIAASNGGTTIDRITGSGDFYGYIRQARLPLAFEVFSENPSTGTDATKTMRITRTVGGVTTTIYGPTTNSNNPGDPSLTYVENGVDDATYDAYGSAAADGSATTFGLVNVTGYVVPYTVYSDGSGTTVISSGNIANNSSLDIDALLTGTQTIKLFAPQSGAYNEYYLPGGSLSGTVNNAAGTSFFSTNRAGISSYVASGYSGLRFTYTPISITYRSSNSYVVAGTLSYQIVEDSTGTVVGSGVVGAGNRSPNTAVLTSNSGTLTVTFVANGSYSPAGTKVRILNDDNSTEIAGAQAFNPGDTKVFSLIPKVNLVFQTTS